MPETYWNGQPTPARKVTVIVADAPQFIRYWAKEAGLVGTERKAVEVTYGGRTFYLDDEDGNGWAKVLGGGGPGFHHRDLEVKPDVKDRE